jgi:hypothetical protein
MGILNKIFGSRFIATEIEHPIWGKMFNDKNGFWNGVIVNFPVINSQMEFSIMSIPKNIFLFFPASLSGFLVKKCLVFV